MAPTEAPINLLDLSTEPTRRTIKVNGDAYPLRNFDEVSLIEQFDFQEKCAGLGKGVTDRNSAEEIRAILSGLFRAIVMDADAIEAKLTDDQKMKVVTAFLDAARAPANPTPAETPTPKTDTSESPACSDSSAVH